jgi:predicted TPR repeat methyltransferase
MDNESNIGGFRPGSGRPKGAQNRRTQALADKLLSEGKCPAEALVRIAESAEAAGEMALAVDAWKAVLPYVHAKPKPVEIDPGQIVLMARDIAEARLVAKPEYVSSFGQRLELAVARLETNKGQQD